MFRLIKELVLASQSERRDIDFAALELLFIDRFVWLPSLLELTDDDKLNLQFPFRVDASEDGIELLFKRSVPQVDLPVGKEKIAGKTAKSFTSHSFAHSLDFIPPALASNKAQLQNIVEQLLSVMSLAAQLKAAPLESINQFCDNILHEQFLLSVSAQTGALRLEHMSALLDNLQRQLSGDQHQFPSKFLKELTEHQARGAREFLARYNANVRKMFANFLRINVIPNGGNNENDKLKNWLVVDDDELEDLAGDFPAELDIRLCHCAALIGLCKYIWRSLSLSLTLTFLT
jgi:hypothetical protein